MAFCPENGAVFADISVQSYIELWCRLKHRDAAYYRKAGSRYIKLLQIEPLLKRLGRELSKGQRRRVQTAVGFLTRPKLFLVDEPFDGLDIQKTNELVEIMHNEAEQMCFMVSSHRMDVMERLADAFLVLQQGKVSSCGSLEKVCSDLCHNSAILRQFSDADALLTLLKRQFPRATATRIGEQIQIVGEGFELESLHAALADHKQNGLQIEAKPASLVDAMNHHLRSLDHSNF
jgi:ABC-type multidrug transport system ATPase subunit